MRGIADLWFRLRALVVPQRMERELKDEMEFHRKMETEKLVAEGMTMADAEREANRRFGSVPREQERTREAWGVGLVSDAISDVQHSFRQFRRNKTFAGVSVLTLSLGIGATIALASVIQNLMLRPLPYPDENAVVHFWEEFNWRGIEYDFARENIQGFESVAAYTTDAQPLQTDAGTTLLPTIASTVELFDVLGVPAALGRTFLPGEDRVGAEPIVVIGYGMWQQELGGDPAVVGRSIMLGGVTRTIVGVAPRGFYFPTPEFRAWIPLTIDPSTVQYASGAYLAMVGRRGEGVTEAGLDSHIQGFGVALGERFNYPARWDKSASPALIPMRDYVLGDVELALLLLFGAVLLILLMAIANAAALILARTTDRAAELSVRAALGAGRGRIGRQVVTEAVVLALVSGAFGALIARFTFGTLVSSLRLADGYESTIAFPWMSIVGGFVVAIVVAGAVALAPLVDIMRGRLGNLRQARSGSGGQQISGRTQGLLVGTEVLLAMTLVTGAALLVRSVDQIQQISIGVDPEGVMTADLVSTDDMEDEERRAVYDEIIRRVTAQPGVLGAGLINRLPIRDGGWQGGTRIEDQPAASARDRRNSYWRTVTAGYFPSMGIELLQGRLFDESDRADGVSVAIVSASFANSVWPGESAIGKRIGGMMSRPGQWNEIVGVVEETRMSRITGKNDIAAYVPLAQAPQAATSQVLIIDTEADVVPALRRIVRETDARVAVDRAGPMGDVVEAAMAQPLRLRFFLMLFAGLGLVLGAVGVYGVVSYSVNRRRAEFGVRMALGATGAGVLKYVVGRGMLPVLIGVAGGVLVSLGLARVVEGFLYNVAATDIRSIVFAGSVLVLTGVLAAAIPAWRAGRTSPVEVLRVE